MVVEPTCRTGHYLAGIEHVFDMASQWMDGWRNGTCTRRAVARSSRGHPRTRPCAAAEPPPLLGRRSAGPPRPVARHHRRVATRPVDRRVVCPRGLRRLRRLDLDHSPRMALRTFPPPRRHTEPLSRLASPVLPSLLHPQPHPILEPHVWHRLRRWSSGAPGAPSHPRDDVHQADHARSGVPLSHVLRCPDGPSWSRGRAAGVLRRQRHPARSVPAVASGRVERDTVSEFVDRSYLTGQAPSRSMATPPHLPLGVVERGPWPPFRHT